MDKALVTLQRWLWCLVVAAVVLAPSFGDLDYKSYAVSIGFFLLFLLEALLFFKNPVLSFSFLESYLALYLAWTCLSYFWSPVDLAASECLGRFLPCVGLYWLVRQGGKEGENPNFLRVWNGLALIAVLYGFLQKLGFDFIVPYAQNGSSIRIFSTFGNPNVYAAFLVLALPIAFLNSLGLKKGSGEKVYGFAAALLLFGSLLLTESRAGCLGFLTEFLLGALLLGRWIWMDRRRRGWAAALISMVLLGAGLLAYRAGSRPTERLQVWEGAVRMIGDKPIQGWGVGQFSLQFQTYMTEELAQAIQRNNSFAEHVHNELLELMVELGLVGLVLAGLFWGRLILRPIHKIWGDPQHKGQPPLAVLGWTLGLLGLGVTNLFDYNCRLPGIAFFLWVSAAMLANAVFPADRIKLKAPVGAAMGLILAAGAVFGLFQETRLLAAVLTESSQKDFLKNVPPDLSAELERLSQAIKAEPDNAGNYHELGNLFAKSGDMEEAQKAFEKEAVLNPRSSGAYLNLGNIYLLTSDKDPARVDLARKCYEKAIQLEPNSVDGHFNLAYVYFLQKDLKAALGELDRVLKIDPQNAKALSLKRQILP